MEIYEFAARKKIKVVLYYFDPENPGKPPNWIGNQGVGGPQLTSEQVEEQLRKRIKKVKSAWHKTSGEDSDCSNDDLSDLPGMEKW